MLPRPVRPEYSTTIPSTGKKVKYNPFTVKEEKVLVLASESGDKDEITNAVINVITNCIVSPSDLRIEDLALFDIEYLFLKARSKSVGESINIVVTDPDDETFSTEHNINIDRIGIDRNPEHSNVIFMDDELQVKMRYPDITFFTEGIEMSSLTNSMNTIAKCIDSIITGDEVYERLDMTEDEVVEWIEGLTSNQYQKLTNFFATMPKLKHSFTVKNTNTGKDFTMVLEGLADFF